MGITDEITDHTGHLVFPLKDITVKFSTKEVDDDHNWANMVKEVARSKIFSESVFLRFHGLVDDESGDLLKLEDGRFLLRSGRVYRMDIVQYLPITDGENNKIERSRTTNLGKLELETMEMHVDALENELEIVGRYDDHTFYFAAQRLREKTFSRVAILGKGSSGFYIPTMVFQVQIASYSIVFIGYCGFLGRIDNNRSFNSYPRSRAHPCSWRIGHLHGRPAFPRTVMILSSGLKSSIQIANHLAFDLGYDRALIHLN